MKLPELFTTSGENSFARRSITERHCATLLEVIESNPVGEPYRSRLLDFRAESLGGRLSDPFAGRGWDPGLFDAQELADWRSAIRPLRGRSWFQLPWYFAESFWFLKLLFAFGYYEPAGPHRLRDPFEPFKRRELPPGLEAASGLGPLLAQQPAEPAGEKAAVQAAEKQAEPAAAQALSELLLASLWGNRMDLSMHALAREYRGGFLRRATHELLIDHSSEAARRLLAARRTDLILDNAGPELVCDLLLAARLLGAPAGSGPPRQMVLHAKRSPFFVSDARPADVRQTIQALAGSPAREVGAAGRLLAGSLAAGRLQIQDHWFWNGPRFFQDLPADLRSQLAACDLVLIKGDANYRRLVGDRRWPASTPMEGLTGHFPAPFAVLRTMKSEIVVDLGEDRVLQLDGEDPEWRINGRRGIVRLVTKHGRA